ncbi:hypothetical protein BC826DRAFT_1046867, partial [Russula brevipes]
RAFYLPQVYNPRIFQGPAAYFAGELCFATPDFLRCSVNTPRSPSCTRDMPSSVIWTKRVSSSSSSSSSATSRGPALSTPFVAVTAVTEDEGSASSAGPTDTAAALFSRFSTAASSLSSGASNSSPPVCSPDSESESLRECTEESGLLEVLLATARWSRVI